MYMIGFLRGIISLEPHSEFCLEKLSETDVKPCTYKWLRPLFFSQYEIITLSLLHMVAQHGG
jgi:hypothetical protein